MNRVKQADSSRLYIQVKNCGGPYQERSKPQKHENISVQANNDTASNPFHVSNQLNDLFLQPIRDTDLNVNQPEQHQEFPENAKTFFNPLHTINYKNIFV